MWVSGYEAAMAAASYPPFTCSESGPLLPFPLSSLRKIRTCTCSRRSVPAGSTFCVETWWWNRTERGWVMPTRRDLGLRVRCVFTDQDSVLRSRLSSQQHHTRLIGVPKNRHHTCTTYYMHTFTHTHTHTPTRFIWCSLEGHLYLQELSLATGRD